MNRHRMLLGLGGALIVAFLASTYVYRQMQRAQPGAGAAAKQAQVVVAAGPLKMGQPLTAADLTLMDWPEGKQPQGALSRTDDCVGRALVVSLAPGELVLDQEMAKREAGAGLSVALPEGMRAVSVGVDDVVAVAGFATPGTIVDVLVTGMGPEGPVTRTLLEHVRVLAVGQELQTEGGKPQSAPVVTLLVSPGDGERLTLASAEGKLHLALRNALDTNDVSPPPAYGAKLFLASAPVAAMAQHVQVSQPARVAVPFMMQIIRGDKVEMKSFPQ
jgi:pilus assembly protein CpaB